MLYDPAPQSRRKECSTDQRLRAAGYHIAQRRGENEAWWISPRGEIVSQTTALEELVSQKTVLEELVGKYAEAVAIKEEKARRYGRKE